MKGITAIYLPSLRGGGAERVMVNLANGFARGGMAVDLVVAKAEGPYLDDVSSSVQVIDLGASRVAWSLPALVRYIRSQQPTAILAAIAHANVIAVIARALANSRARLVLSEHTPALTPKVKAKNCRDRCMYALMRWAYRRADMVVAVSMGVGSSLFTAIGVPKDRIRTIYNPVVDESMLRRSHQAVSHPWFRSDAPPVILGVGRLTAAKDFATLIRAFALVRRVRRAYLVVLGEGGLRRELEQLVQYLGVEESVSLHGFVENPFSYMRQARVFVLSSAWEGFGNVLVEAMACGTPVVSTDCPSGPAEILENGKWGRLVPVGDVKALAAAILVTLDDRVHPHTVTRAMDFGLECALEQYGSVLCNAPQCGGDEVHD